MFQDNQHYICFGFKKHVSSELLDEIEQLSREEDLCLQLIRDFTILLQTYIVKMQCSRKEAPLKVYTKEDFRETVCDFSELLGQELRATTPKYKGKINQRQAFQHEIINRMRKTTLNKIVNTLNPDPEQTKIYSFQINKILSGNRVDLKKLGRFLAKQQDDDCLIVVQEFMKIAIQEQLNDAENLIDLTRRLNLRKYGKGDVQKFMDDFRRHMA